MQAFKLSVILLVAFLGNAFAANNTHIVMLKSSLSTKVPNTRSRISQYAFVRETLVQRMNQELKPFVAGLGKSADTNATYLPIISAVGMTLTAGQVSYLKNHPSVLKVIPNGRIQLDKPTRPVFVSPTRTRSVTLNQALVLHKVDELINMGVDISKAGKTVGIIDTGIESRHPDLAPKLLRYKDYKGTGSAPIDTQGHGTHVAGIIAGGNASGTQIGVYPGAKLIVSNAIEGGYSDMLAALQWMLDPDGNPNTPDQPYVINNSWHIGNSDPEPFYTALQTLKDADILVCFSAGNAGTSGITRPKEWPYAFTTAAVDANAKIGSFSSWGPATYKGKQINKPEVSSMGVDVMSTMPGGKYAKKSGTSMASPFTAGAIALLGAHFPQLSPFVIAEVIRETSDPAVRAPWDKQYGYGIVNVHAAYLKLKKGVR